MEVFNVCERIRVESKSLLVLALEFLRPSSIYVFSGKACIIARVLVLSGRPLVRSFLKLSKGILILIIIWVILSHLVGRPENWFMNNRLGLRLHLLSGVLQAQVVLLLGSQIS